MEAQVNILQPLSTDCLTLCKLDTFISKICAREQATDLLVSREYKKSIGI